LNATNTEVWTDQKKNRTWSTIKLKPQQAGRHPVQPRHNLHITVMYAI